MHYPLHRSVRDLLSSNLLNILQTIPESTSLTGVEVVGKLNYIKTFQSRFYPVRGGDLEHDSLYPYLTLKFQVGHLMFLKLLNYLQNSDVEQIEKLA